MSLPLWECGLKCKIDRLDIILIIVTPLVGVWIEMNRVCTVTPPVVVTPRVGVWIEIYNVANHNDCNTVTPLVGVWIEIGWNKC